MIFDVAIQRAIQNVAKYPPATIVVAYVDRAVLECLLRSRYPLAVQEMLKQIFDDVERAALLPRRRNDEHMAIRERVQRLITNFVCALVGLVQIHALWASNERVVDVRVRRERLIDISKTQTAALPLQFRHIAWSIRGEIAVTSGRQLFVVDPNTGRVRSIEEAVDGGESPITWLTEGRALVGEWAPGTVFQSKIVDLSRDPPVIKRGYLPLLDSKALRAIRLSKDEEGVVAVGTPNPHQHPMDSPIVVYSLRSLDPVLKWTGFPKDGTAWHVDAEGGAAIVARSEMPYVAMYVHHVIRPRRKDDPTDIKPVAEQDVWIADITTGAVRCRLHVYDNGSPDAWGNVDPLFSGLAFSTYGHQLAFSSSKAFDIYETHDCKRTRRLWPTKEGRDIDKRVGGKLVFTADDRFLIASAIDIHAPKGGWLRIWRTSDWQLVFEESVPAADAIAADPLNPRFVLTTSGQLRVYRIEKPVY